MFETNSLFEQRRLLAYVLQTFISLESIFIFLQYFIASCISNVFNAFLCSYKLILHLRPVVVKFRTLEHSTTK